MKSVPEAVTYLIQNTVYREILETLEPTLVHRGNIEKLLIVSLYQDYTRIYLFATLEQRKFLKLYLKRYEVELINYCLRIVINHYQEPFDLNHKRAFLTGIRRFHREAHSFQDDGRADRKPERDGILQYLEEAAGFGQGDII